VALGPDVRQDDGGGWARTERDEIGLLAGLLTAAAQWCAPDRHYTGRGRWTRTGCKEGRITNTLAQWPNEPCPHPSHGEDAAGRFPLP